MKPLWCVLISDNALTRPDPVYHEYASPGKTKCGRNFYLAMRIERNSSRHVWVRRANAEAFARPCRVCAEENV